MSVKRLALVVLAAVGAIAATASPAFALSATADTTWMTNGKVFALAQSGNTLYVGGKFGQLVLPGRGDEDQGQEPRRRYDATTGDGDRRLGPEDHPGTARPARCERSPSRATARCSTSAATFDAVDGVTGEELRRGLHVGRLARSPAFQHKFTTAVHVIKVTPSLVYVGGAFTEGRRRGARQSRRPRTRRPALSTRRGTRRQTTPSARWRSLRRRRRCSSAGSSRRWTASPGSPSPASITPPARSIRGPSRPASSRRPRRPGRSCLSATVCTPASAMAPTTPRRSGSTTASSGARCGASAPSGTLRAWRCRTTAPGSSWAATSEPAALQQTVCGQPLHGLMSVNPVNGVAYCDWFPAITPFGSNFTGAWCLLSTGTKLYVGGLIDAINGVTHVGLARFPL